MVDVMVDGVGLFKGGYTDFIGPIQMPVFFYWIYIGAGTNNADNFFILLKCVKIIYIYSWTPLIFKIAALYFSLAIAL